MIVPFARHFFTDPIEITPALEPIGIIGKQVNPLDLRLRGLHSAILLNLRRFSPVFQLLDIRIVFWYHFGLWVACKFSTEVARPWPERSAQANLVKPVNNW